MNVASKAAPDKPKRKKPELTLVEPTEDPNLNVLLYGDAKVGKTIGAASAPKPMLYLNADRPNATRVAHSMFEFTEAKMEGLTTLEALYYAIDTGDYRSVVVDPIGDVYRILVEDLSHRVLRPSLPNYGDSSTHFERFLRGLCEKPVNVILVAHELRERDEESGTFQTIPFTGSKSGSPVMGQKIKAMVDVIGYCGVIPAQGEKDSPRYVAQLRAGGGRGVGSRFNLGAERELDLEEWVGKVVSDEAAANKKNRSRKAA